MPARCPGLGGRPSDPGLHLVLLRAGCEDLVLRHMVSIPRRRERGLRERPSYWVLNPYLESEASGPK
eukprot:10186299-Lingulodinium_polyedra.AAC.1